MGASAEMHDSPFRVVDQVRAALAALVPIGIEHEVVEDELAVVRRGHGAAPDHRPPSNPYSFSILTIGSARRSALSASRCRPLDAIDASHPVEIVVVERLDLVDEPDARVHHPDLGVPDVLDLTGGAP